MLQILDISYRSGLSSFQHALQASSPSSGTWIGVIGVIGWIGQAKIVKLEHVHMFKLSSSRLLAMHLATYYMSMP